jgi:hypothetical protein
MMGFFSWLTSDTEESIANVHTGQCRPVYLLQPEGQPPICEPAYEGYGKFGGVDAYEWVARENAPSDVLATLDRDQVRSIGHLMANGTILRDTHTGALWSIHVHVPGGLGVKVNNFQHSWMTVIPELGMTPNELRESGRFVSARLRDHINIKYPLKFSFDKNAVYEDLPAAKNCPHQGYFLPEDEMDDSPSKKPKTINAMKL